MRWKINRRHLILIASLVSLVIFINHLNNFFELPFNWFSVDKLDELKLLEFGKQVKDTVSFNIYSSTTTDADLTVCENTKTVKLRSGINEFGERIDECEQRKVEVKAGDSSIRFYFEIINETSTQENFINLKLLDVNVNGPKVSVEAKGDYYKSIGGYKAVDISLNDKIIRSPQYFFPSGEHNFTIKEDFLVSSGTYDLKLSLDAVTASKTFSVKKNVHISDYLVLSYILFIAFYLKRKLKIETAYATLILFSLLFLLLPLNFQTSRNFGIEFLTPIILLITLFLLPKLKLELPKLGDAVKQAIIIAVLFTLIVAFLRYLIGDQATVSPYFLRHAQASYLYDSVDYYDDLSYLGRPFSYPAKLFFMFISSLSNITTLDPLKLIPLIHPLLLFLYIMTLYLIFSQYKNPRQKIIGTLVIATQFFLFMNIATSMLHLFAYLLLNLSIFFFLTKNRLLSVLTLITAVSAHPINLVYFAGFAYAATRFNLSIIKRVIPLVVLAGLISLVFYLPHILKYGAPYEIAAKKWGYLISFGLDGALYAFQFSFLLITPTVVLGLLERKFRIATILFLLSLVLFLFFSYRFHVVTVAMFAFLFVMIFENYLKRRYAFFIFVLLPIVSLLPVALLYSGFTSWCSYGVINENCIKPMNFINQFTSSQDSVAINTWLGHVETHYGQRKVLADFYVEYADSEKLDAQERFYKNLDVGALDKFGVNFAVLDDWEHERDIENVDKIYENGFFHVFRIK